jgi:hypothetical protein
MKKMIAGFQRINEKYRKRSQRKDSMRLTGIRSLECNFNSQRKTYNPHLHLIVASKEMAELLTTEWLALWTSKWTNKSAQYSRPVTDLKKDLIETIKYGSKIFCEAGGKNGKKDSTIYIAALYNIIEAMSGLRIFERFGFNLQDQSQRKSSGARLASDFYEWKFLPQYHDWQNTENELVLSAYAPTAEFLSLLENHVDTQLE